MNISEAGLRFIADWEGLRLAPYDDLGPGRGNCTVGVGHLIHLGPCDGRAEELPYLPNITEQQAYRVLNQDAMRFVAHVNTVITVALTQNQFDALCSFAFNLGSLLGVSAVVNAHGNVRAEMAKYVYSNGQVQQGLVRRRAAEADLFEKSDLDREEDDGEMPYPWLTSKDLPPGSPYRTYIIVGGRKRIVESFDHENMLKVLGQVIPANAPAAVGYKQIKAIPSVPGTPDPDAP